MRWLAVLALAACGSPPEEAFGFLGVVHGELSGGSVIGLWTVRQTSSGRPAHTYKLGDGTATDIEFAISYRIDPPADALEDGVGIGAVAMLPGTATLPEGEVDPSQAFLIGSTPDSAVIYKQPGGVAATYPWLDLFPDGYACAVCDRTTQPDRWVPADCTFVTVERAFTNPCAY